MRLDHRGSRDIALRVCGDRIRLLKGWFRGAFLNIRQVSLSDRDGLKRIDLSLQGVCLGSVCRCRCRCSSCCFGRRGSSSHRSSGVCIRTSLYRLRWSLSGKAIIADLLLLSLAYVRNNLAIVQMLAADQCPTLATVMSTIPEGEWL